jgi:molecular chaperone GrpE
VDIFNIPRGKTGTEDNKSQPDDLITLISNIMVENERLQDIRSELEARTSSPEILESFVKRLLTILDGFERILNLTRQYPQSKEIDNWLKSVETVYYRLYEILEKIGLKRLDTIGNRVNLNYHDVVEYKQTKDYPNETVIFERQKGYFLNGKLIRDAKVVVAHNPSTQ